LKQGNLDISIQYAENVLSGKIKSGLELRQSCKRFLSDLDRTDIYYNGDIVDRVILFISHLKHFTGRFNDKPFYLEPWQTFIICNIYGFYHKVDNRRKYKNGYIEVARKNGKTQLFSAISLYELIGSGEPNSEVIFSANSREQAKLALNITKNFCNKLDNKQKYIIQYHNQIKYRNNELKVISSDSSKWDGLNASCILIDELHAAKDNKVYNVLKSSQGMRDNPLFMVITTAGLDVDSFCFQLRTYYKEVLSGVKEDDSSFILIYTLDDGDDWTNPENFIKSNPNFKITINESFLVDEINKAKQSPSEMVGVQIKHLNMWQTSNTINKWISVDVLNSSLKNITINDEMFKDVDFCFCGIDLGSTMDINSISYLLVKDNIYYYFNNYYLPEKSLNNFSDNLMYREFSKNNQIILTPGNVSDYDYILNDVLKMNKIKNINKI